MLKHVGKHNDRKIAVLYRQVPNEDHMCLLVYSDLLPRLVHDEIMKVLESPAGQAAKDLADALFRNVMADGRNTLEVLHREKFIKKVPCNQVIITPTTKSNVRLDELNSILNEMEQGEEAVRRMAQLDSELGVGNGKRRQPADVREVGAPVNTRSAPARVPDIPSVDSVLSDSDLASQRLAQAEKMKASAAQLLAEAERLITEAATFGSATTPSKPKRNARKNQSKRINIDTRERWKSILKNVSKDDVPVELIKTVIVNLLDDTRVDIDITELIEEGFTPNEIKKMLNERLEKLDAFIKDVDFYIDIDSVAKTVQPVTDDILKHLS